MELKGHLAGPLSSSGMDHSKGWKCNSRARSRCWNLQNSWTQPSHVFLGYSQWINPSFPLFFYLQMNPNLGGIFGSWINDPCGSIPTQGIPRSQKNNAVMEFAAVLCQEIKFQAGFPTQILFHFWDQSCFFPVNRRRIGISIKNSGPWNKEGMLGR